MKTIKAIGKVTKGMVQDVTKGLKKNLNKVATVFQVAYPVTCLLVGCSLEQVIIADIGVNIVATFLKRLHCELNGTIESGMPIPPRSLVSVNNGGFIGFRHEGDDLDALQYLNELEGYLRGKGVKL